ncbi:tetratricopeptide repeat protein [Leifsonia shinshuensis]|uniref:Tetratricopeptide (TPR) repeat protein n=1 Tax=Leifsonia shinshuensis TaxID=150026 RepID=A0A853CWF9_9MICO|nr:tetratricopeptide repeat protein [Leifsonia shinshuensis]NYJ24792.1 tetratricopeptide (TPR) repeat protein [Leifsonia shinshuensis]
MITVDAPDQDVISFGTAKLVLSGLGLTPRVADLAVARSLRLLYPLDAKLTAFVREGATSLTDAASADEQIRFFQRRRVERNYIRLAEWATARGPVSVRIGNAAAIDGPSRELLRIAAAVAGWTVEYSEARLVRSAPAVDPETGELLDALERLPSADDADRVWRAAFDFVNAGDAWTAVGLGRRLAAAESSARVWNLLAIGHAMLDQTETAEYYYDRWADSDDPLDGIRALYGKAMLYARHHPDGLRDLETSGELLNEAFALFDRLPEAERSSDSVVFDEVFNRNGYALILFRRGEVEEALRSLQTGIERLSGTSEKIAIHRSVLMYNLAQCLQRLGRFEEAIAAYERLIAVDPHMAEYRLEAAKCLAAGGRREDAVARCREAIEIDSSLPVAWSLLGFSLGQVQQWSSAAEAYERAARLDHASDKARLDAAHHWILAGRTEAAERALETAVIARMSAKEFERHAILRAETMLRNGRRQEAVGSLLAALERYPRSEALRSNHDALVR